MKDVGDLIVRSRPAPYASAYEPVGFRQYWNTVYRHKWVILGFAALVTAAVAFAVRHKVPIYRASATILIESKEANIVSIQDVYGVDTQSPDYIQTQFEILKSRPVIEAVVERLQLHKVPDFASAAVAGDAYGPVVDKYQRNIQVTPVPRTQLVKISIDTTSPKLSADIVNAHAEAFIARQLDTRASATKSAQGWLGGRMEELKQKLDASEARLQDYKEREHLVDIDGVQTLPARQLNELTTKLIDAKRDLSQTRSNYAQVNSVREDGLDAKLTIPAIRSDPLVQQLRQARADADLKVAELSKRYGPQHPKMRSAVSERASIEQSLELQVDSVMESIRNEHEILEGQTQSIAAAIDSAKTDAQRVGRKESEYRALLREAETNRQLYDMFYKRITETAETSKLDTTNARVIEPATAPSKPNGVQKPMIIGAAPVMAMLLAIAIAILSEHFSRTIKHAVDVERKIGVPLLGYVPRLKKMRDEAGAYVFGQRGHREFDEAIRTLRTGVSLSSLDKNQKIVMVTSSLPGEGKSTVAGNLALAFAQLEKVLLIDADLRRPAVAIGFGLESKGPGLADLCAGTAPLVSCLQREVRKSLDVLTAGTLPPDPQKLLGSAKMQELLKTFKDEYDRVIIDCPPTLPVSDALLLAYHAEVLIYVIKAESTSVSQIKNGLQKYKKTPATVIGTVLNQVDVKKLASYGEYGGGYYGDYYAAAAPPSA